LTSIDRDGTKIGFDCVMNAARLIGPCRFRVIALGWRRALLEHFVDVFTAGRADAAARRVDLFIMRETSVPIR